MLAATVGFDLHRGAVAAADRRPLPSLADVAAGASDAAVLEGLNDPENLGAVARSARAFGDRRARARPARASIRTTAARSASAWARCSTCPSPGRRTGPASSTSLHAAGFETWALTPDRDADDLWSLAVPARVAVLLGAEGPGLSAAALAAATRRVRIPIAADVDSLNVGHAAAVAFAHVARRRGREVAQSPLAAGTPAPGRNVASSAVCGPPSAPSSSAIAAAAPSWP